MRLASVDFITPADKEDIINEFREHDFQPHIITRDDQKLYIYDFTPYQISFGRYMKPALSLYIFQPLACFHYSGQYLTEPYFGYKIWDNLDECLRTKLLDVDSICYVAWCVRALQAAYFPIVKNSEEHRLCLACQVLVKYCQRPVATPSTSFKNWFQSTSVEIDPIWGSTLISSVINQIHQYQSNFRPFISIKEQDMIKSIKNNKCPDNIKRKEK